VCSLSANNIIACDANNPAQWGDYDCHSSKPKHLQQYSEREYNGVYSNPSLSTPSSRPPHHSPSRVIPERPHLRTPECWGIESCIGCGSRHENVPTACLLLVCPRVSPYLNRSMKASRAIRQVFQRRRQAAPLQGSEQVYSLESTEEPEGDDKNGKVVG